MSEVSICNKALALLGESAITSLNDATQKGQLCAQFYPSSRDAVLSARLWRFATARRVSNSADVPGLNNPDPTYPQWGTGFVHSIPAEFLQVFRAFQQTRSAQQLPAEWQRMGRYILSPSPTLFLMGTVRIENTDQYSPLFNECLSARMASDLAVPITSNRQLMVDMWSLYNDKLSEAAVRDGQQGRSEKTNATTITTARSL